MGMRVVAVVVLAWCGLAGCGDSRVPPTVAVEAPAQPVIGKARTRYQFNGQCVALRLEASGRYVTAASGGYRASAADAAQAEGFRLQASALGRYLIDGLDGSLLSASGMAVAPVALASAGDGAEWTLRGATDTVLYPNAPEVDAPADVTALAAYRAFVDPESRHERWHWRAAGGQGLAADSSGVLVLAATPSVFLLEALPTERCAVFAEAQDNVVGETFKGTRPDGTVTGWADTHLHATSTSFLGGAKPGFPFHRFGVTHALASCEVEHGPTGQRDVVGSLFTSDFDGHATDGWPTFTDWPSRTATTHEATYYKWIERAWKSGLRLIVNFAVDNGTLCEIERNAAGTPARNCNEMVNALQQLGTAHAMQDYIDAQYGGRGAGWCLEPARLHAALQPGQYAGGLRGNRQRDGGRADLRLPHERDRRTRRDRDPAHAPQGAWRHQPLHRPRVRQRHRRQRPLRRHRAQPRHQGKHRRPRPARPQRRGRGLPRAGECHRPLRGQWPRHWRVLVHLRLPGRG